MMHEASSLYLISAMIAQFLEGCFVRMLHRHNTPLWTRLVVAYRWQCFCRPVTTVVNLSPCKKLCLADSVEVTVASSGRQQNFVLICMLLLQQPISLFLS